MWLVGGLEVEEFLRFQTTKRPHIECIHYTTSCIAQSDAPEDGQNNFPKHVELIRFINKQLLLHLVGCLPYYLLGVHEISSFGFSAKFISTGHFWLKSHNSNKIFTSVMPTGLGASCDPQPFLKWPVEPIVKRNINILIT
jgi:hypothetical protein